ncbi:MAG: alpha/beta hydrolase [Exilispira sp.]|jgi:pimeloyl-ACP methyl ester carboxylesterase|nr:alpha/beta hydrolase [Exilispira sp.]
MAFHRLTNILQFDFQINRILTYGTKACDHGEVIEASRRIHDLNSWFQVWYSLGEKAEKENRFLHAAYYYRLSEFFLHDKDPFKEKTYKLSVGNFNKIISEDPNVQTVFVPYKNSEMKTMIFSSTAEEKGKLVVFGGYDSFIEEFYLAIKEIAETGYTVYLFEGPGQGLTLKKGIPFEHQWEKPLGTILDYFNLDNVTIIGISWGGYLALRATAFEKRVKRVVAYDILYDGFDCMTNPFPIGIRQIFRLLFLLKQKTIINFLLTRFMKKKIIIDWAISHGMYITNTKSPYDFYMDLKKHTLRGITGKITCDVLLLAGEKDHYIPLKHYYILMKKLKKAHSLHGKIFTEEEGGEQHCQVGNHQLAIKYIYQWLNDEMH